MPIRIPRRQLVSTLGGAAARPIAAHAQQPRKAGVLSGLPENDPEGDARAAAFQASLQRLGWTQGCGVHINTAWGTSDLGAMQRLAKEAAKAPGLEAPPKPVALADEVIQ
jgi:hypothetical protein